MFLDGLFEYLNIFLYGLSHYTRKIIYSHFLFKWPHEVVPLYPQIVFDLGSYMRDSAATSGGGMVGR